MSEIISVLEGQRSELKRYEGDAWFYFGAWGDPVSIEFNLSICEYNTHNHFRIWRATVYLRRWGEIIAIIYADLPRSDRFPRVYDGQKELLKLSETLPKVLLSRSIDCRLSFVLENRSTEEDLAFIKKEQRELQINKCEIEAYSKRRMLLQLLLMKIHHRADLKDSHDK